MKFTKKPVTIEAIQWTGANLREVICFTDGPPDVRHDHAAMKWEEYNDLVARDGLKIFTLEGKMNAAVGDWIIKGVKGEHYPCKPDIFEMTYGPAAPGRSGKLADDEEEAAFQQRFREGMRAAMALRAPEADSSSAAPSDVTDQAGFEAYCAKAGALSTVYAKDMTDTVGRFPATYKNHNTETAWRAWANRPVAAPAPTVGSAAPSDLEIRVRKVLEGVHIETGRTDEFECVVANIVAAIAATSPTMEGAWKTLADKAIAVLCRHIVPDGISDKEALNELYGIFDGPEYRAALDAPSPTGGSLSSTCAAIDPPLLPKYMADFCKFLSREEVWNHAALSGWRAAQPALATPRQTEDEQDGPCYGVMDSQPEDGSGLVAALNQMRAAFHVNMLRAFPDKSHAEISAEIDRTCDLAPKETAALTPELISDLNDAISAARWQASHAGSTTRIKRWDDVRDRLAAILAAAPTPPAPL